jgi:PhnB protein
MLDYEDGPAAMDWLTAAFGFQEVTRHIGEDGLLAHGEMRAGNGLIMLATPTPAYESPKRHREHCAQARASDREVMRALAKKPGFRSTAAT